MTDRVDAGMTEGWDDADTARCRACQEKGEPFALAMAFQPIVDVERETVFAYEALVRGPNGEPAADILAAVTPENRYAFDQQCRVTAIEAAVAAGILDTDALVSINFLPNAVYSPKACIQLTLATARANALPTDRLMFEFTEHERMTDTAHVSRIIDCYAKMGFATAIDDFGAGHAGLGLLANFRTSHIKLDMDLIPRHRRQPRAANHSRGDNDHGATAGRRRHRRRDRDGGRTGHAHRTRHPATCRALSSRIPR